MRNRPIVTFGYFPVAPYERRRYGLSNLIGDLILTFLTGGLWAIWWFIREVAR